MKKLLAFLLAAIMVISMAACNTNDPADTTGEPAGGTDPSSNDPVDTSTTPVDPEAERYGGHLNVSVGSTSWTYVDPAKSTGAGNYLWTRMVWEPPLTRDASGNICPNVCDFELSDDALTLKLWVREGVTFHDGSAVEIEDVVASVKRAVHKSPRSYVSAHIKDVVIENGVATFTFDVYDEKTMYYIACINPFIGVMPKEIAEKYSYESEMFIDNVADAIGTGPYKIIDYKEGEFVEMARHEGYVAVPEGYDGYAAPKKAYMDTVTWHFPTDSNIQTMALLNGEYDMGGSLEDYDSQLESAGLVKVETSLSTTVRSLQFNTFGNSITSNDPNLRKAIIAAIDIPELLEIDLGKNYHMSGNWTLDSIYHLDILDNADYMGEDNIELAKKYLAASNYNGEEIQLVVPATQADSFTMICAYLNAAGINTNLRAMEGTSAEEFRADPNNDWDFYLGMPAMNNTPVLLSDAIMKTDYKSEAKDALLAELGQLPAGSAAYLAKWEELAELMVDECAIVAFGRYRGQLTVNADLNWDGDEPLYYDCYWSNPADHTK